jgi:subtilisin family serine protease
MRSFLWLVLVLSVAAPHIAAAADKPSYFDLLSTDRVAAFEFVKKHPEWDGRGTAVAVLDTGVDMSVPGLAVTSTGEVKVVEARDFTGQGAIRLRKPKVVSERGEQVFVLDGTALAGYDRLNPRPPLESVTMGVLDERRFRNSSVSDVNFNGSLDDRFSMIMGTVTEGNASRTLLWVDVDADGRIDDEKPNEDYSISHVPFFFAAAGRDDSRVSMAIAPELVPQRQEVLLHFADGSHGSHVAGIATGFRLFGKDGYNGIAPGARVLSLKIGDNTLSGGSTVSESMKKALEFAGDWSNEHNTPVAVNVSYGIGTEAEGKTEIDRIADQVLRKYPLLSMATSAGNSGPGLSSVGTPAGATLAFSAGALLTRENARSLYGASIKKDVIFYFSSRGGELGKPDGLAPGVAASQVPPWEGWIVMRGTSMASPQAAGCLALLASAAVHQSPPLKFNGGLLARALRNSGRPLPEHSLVDQGAGVINVPDAWESVKKLASRTHADIVAGYEVSGECPTCPDGSARTAFFRAGTYLPARPEAVSFTVTPLLMSQVPPEPKENFFETVDLTVEGGDWIEPAGSSMVFRKSGSVSLDVFLDPKAIKEPGVHAALIRGTSRETGRSKASTLFELWAVAVVPYVFDITSGLTRSFEDRTMAPGDVHRYFLRVPEGAASMRVDLSPVKGKYTSSSLALFDPDGREYELVGGLAESRTGDSGHALVPGKELTPGVWEVDVVTYHAARGDSSYNLLVAFSGFRYEAPEEFYYSMGSPARSTFTLRTLFDQVFEGRGQGGLNGFFRSQVYSSEGDRISLPLSMDKSIAQVQFKLEMDAATYSRFTDVSVTVLDGAGNAVVKSGFTSRFLTFSVPNPSAGADASHYTIEILGALAANDGKPWSVSTEERYETVKQYSASVWCDGYGYFLLYPNRTYNCEFELAEIPVIAPEGFLYYGEIRFRDAKSKRDALVMPLVMRLGQ